MTGLGSRVALVVAWASLGCLVPPALQAGTLCVDPDDGACFSTIQLAVDAAVGGDIIEVRPRSDGLPYSEAVTVTTNNITIRGSEPVSFPIQTFEDLLAIDWTAERQLCPVVNVHACETAAVPDKCGSTFGNDWVFDVDALNVTIERLTVAFGGRGVVFSPGSHGATLENNCFVRNTGAWQIGQFEDRVFGATIRQNRVFSSNTDQNIYADELILERNIVHLSEGFNIRGDELTASLNAVWTTTDQESMEIRGDNAVITNNWLRASDSAGLSFSGDTAQISGNLVEIAPARAGLRVRSFFIDDTEMPSENVTVSGNTVVGATYAGIWLVANNSEVSGNHVEASGLDITNFDTELRGAGIWIAGSHNQVLNNTVTQGGAAGIMNGGHAYFLSNNNFYDGNVVDHNASSGILIWEGLHTVVSNNQVLNNAGEGINNLAPARYTRLENNTSSGNRRDICNCGVISSFQGNTFTTGGGDAACIVERGDATSCAGKFGLLIDGFE